MSSSFVILIMLCLVLSDASFSYFKSCSTFCFDRPPDVIINANNLLECAKLCEDVNFQLRETVDDHFVHVSSILEEVVSTASALNVSLNYFNFECSPSLPSIYIFNSTGLCYAFEFKNENSECGLFIDSSSAPTITPNAASCNLYQWKKDAGACYFSYKDCHDIPSSTSGIHWVVSRESVVPVYCLFNEFEKYTVVQRRVSNKQNFRKGWQEYTKGFGDFNANFWIGSFITYSSFFVIVIT